MSPSVADSGDISPVIRSREENQERAFVAASRRKDRSLDARLESANRASLLHKKRTGKALNITREIVQNEAMYEEIDERYQEKRLRMLQAHNLVIEEQFKRRLVAAFTAGANSTRQQTIAREKGVRPLHVDVTPAPQNIWPSCSTPPLSAGMTPSYASTSSASSEYMAQIHSPRSSSVLSNTYLQHHQVVPGYLTPSLTPTWGGTNESTYPYPVTSPNAHVSMMSMDLDNKPFRQRLASLPENVFMRSTAMAMTTPLDPQLEDSSRSEDQGSRAQSEPLQMPLKTEADHSSISSEPFATLPGGPFALPDRTLATSELSSNTSGSYPGTPMGSEDVFLSQPTTEFFVPEEQIRYDPEFYAFNEYASTLPALHPQTVEPNFDALPDWNAYVF